MNKQIEELANGIFVNCQACLLEEEANMIAEYVIEKEGYRKASDVAREILEKLVERSTFGLVDIDYAFKIAKEMGVDVKNGKC